MKKKLPVEHHLLFCTGNKCMGKGSEDLKVLAQNIRDQTPDLSTLVITKMGCLKQCESGPMAILYPEGYWFSDMNTSRTVKLLDQIKDQVPPLPENIYFILGKAE